MSCASRGSVYGQVTSFITLPGGCGVGHAILQTLLAVVNEACLNILVEQSASFFQIGSSNIAYAPSRGDVEGFWPRAAPG